MTNTTPPPAVTLESKIHPATTVSNIKNYVPIILEIESSQYASWATLFTIHCKAFLVYGHISPRPQETASSSSPTDDWDRLDAIVLQWLYGTISNDLLHTIIDKTATAYDAWKAIEDIFQDNQATRAIHLLNRFSNTRLDTFPNVSAYCQQLKLLADQLANVNAPVESDRLVLQLIAGLNEQYEGIATILTNMKPLPSFYVARSKIIEVETRKADHALQSSKAASAALSATTGRNQSEQPRSEASSYGRGRGFGRRRRGGRSFGRGRYQQQAYNSAYFNYPPWMLPWVPLGPWNNNNYNAQSAKQNFSWPNPPCPYPNTRNQVHSQAQPQGLLGLRAQQSNYAAYSPTDIEQAMYTMSLQQPDPTQYMDTGASSTMTHEQGSQDQGTTPSMQQQQ